MEVEWLAAGLETRVPKLAPRAPIDGCNNHCTFHTDRIEPAAGARCISRVGWRLDQLNALLL